MALRRKLEEKNLQLLRELAAQAQNKQCLDCGQRGPTYVNMTIGSFVCTSCSGRLRGLTPPHRVKSISMASFSAEEIEFIKQRGNEWCRAVWLGSYDPSRHPEVDAKDDQQIKDLMAVKYEKKRYYVDPSVAFKERPVGGQPSPPAPAATSGAESVPPVRPLSKLAGGPIRPIVLNQNATTSATTAPPAQKKNIDLLADLSPLASSTQADPFSPTGDGGSGGSTQNALATDANFANFANFEALNASGVPAGAAQPAAPASFANFNSSAAALSAIPISSPAPAPAAAAAAAVPAAASGDRYAALKELDEVLKAEVEPKLDWASAGPREPVVVSQGWAAFSGGPAPSSNGSGPYGQSPQQQQQQAHGLAGYPLAQFAPPATSNGFTPGNPWSQPAGLAASYSPYSPAGYGSYGAPYVARYGGPLPDLSVPTYSGSSGSPGLLAGQWAAPGQQAAGWGPTPPAPPAANPFMSCNGATPANPRNPFL